MEDNTNLMLFFCKCPSCQKRGISVFSKAKATGRNVVKCKECGTDYQISPIALHAINLIGIAASPLLFFVLLYNFHFYLTLFLWPVMMLSMYILMIFFAPLKTNKSVANRDK